MADTDKTAPDKTKNSPERARRNPRDRKPPLVEKRVEKKVEGKVERNARPKAEHDGKRPFTSPPAPGRGGDGRRGGREDRAERRGAPRARGERPTSTPRDADDGHRRPAARGGAMVELPKSGAKIVGGPRNEHGTRVARRVTCARCQSADHVPYVPKDPSKALCRTCASEVLMTYEAGVRVRTPTRKTACNLCGAPFELPVSAEDDGDPLCPSCLRGFTSWQGSVDVPFAERGNVVVEERLSGALVRKRKE